MVKSRKNRKTRVNLNNRQRLEICTRYETTNITQNKLRTWAKNHFHLPTKPSKTLITRTLQNKEALNQLNQEGLNRNVIKIPLARIEKEIKTFITTMASSRRPATDEEIKIYAEIIADREGSSRMYDFSDTWLQGFYQRHPQLEKTSRGGDMNVIYLTTSAAASDNNNLDDDQGNEFSNMSYTSCSTTSSSSSDDDADAENSNDNDEKEVESTYQHKELIDSLETILEYMIAENEEEIQFMMTAVKILGQLRLQATRD